MAKHELHAILRHIRRLSPELASVADTELLDRYKSKQDSAALELLIWRHAKLILGVCQRILRNAHDAEDAFQATVLILARKATSISKREAVASWLYKVAYRAALSLKADRDMRSARERQGFFVENVPAPV